MRAVLVAPRAILLPFDPLRVLPAVLVGEVVAVPTLSAFENDLFAWHVVLSYHLTAIGQLRHPGLPLDRQFLIPDSP
jgi:hypothetical protein